MHFLLCVLTMVWLQFTTSAGTGEVRVVVGCRKWTATKEFYSNSRNYITVTQGIIVISIHKEQVHSSKMIITNASFTENGFLADYISIDMFYSESDQGYTQIELAGKLTLAEVQATLNEPYHIDVTVNMNKGNLISLVDAARTFPISARKGILKSATEILHVGMVDIAIGQKYKLKRDEMERVVRVTRTIGLFLEITDQDPIYTLITIENSGTD